MFFMRDQIFHSRAKILHRFSNVSYKGKLYIRNGSALVLSVCPCMRSENCLARFWISIDRWDSYCWSFPQNEFGRHCAAQVARKWPRSRKNSSPPQQNKISFRCTQWMIETHIDLCFRQALTCNLKPKSLRSSWRKRPILWMILQLSKPKTWNMNFVAHTCDSFWQTECIRPYQSVWRSGNQSNVFEKPPQIEIGKPKFVEGKHPRRGPFGHSK